MVFTVAATAERENIDAIVGGPWKPVSLNWVPRVVLGIGRIALPPYVLTECRERLY